MSVEFIGYISHADQSEIRPAQGDVLDQEHLVQTAQAHEQAGFDRVLVAHHSSNPDGILLAAHVAAQTTKLQFMIAHRPGFIAPTYAARLFATFDQLTNGRGGIHIITGGNDAEQRQDGDFLDHAARYQRTDEWLEIVRRTWTSETPFDFHGQHFRSSRRFPRSSHSRSRICRSSSAVRRTLRSRSRAVTRMSTRCGVSRWRMCGR